MQASQRLQNHQVERTLQDIRLFGGLFGVSVSHANGDYVKLHLNVK